MGGLSDCTVQRLWLQFSQSRYSQQGSKKKLSHLLGEIEILKNLQSISSRVIVPACRRDQYLAEIGQSTSLKIWHYAEVVLDVVVEVLLMPLLQYTFVLNLSSVHWIFPSQLTLKSAITRCQFRMHTHRIQSSVGELDAPPQWQYVSGKERHLTAPHFWGGEQPGTAGHRGLQGAK